MTEQFLHKLRRKCNTRNAQFHYGKEIDKTDLVEILFRSTELGDEVGEVLGAVKKLARLRRGMAGGKSEEESLANLKEEIGDAMITLDRVADLFDIDIAEVTASKFDKTSEQKGLKERW